MSRDWYKDHPLSPEAYPDSEYLDWAQDNGLYVDAAGNVDYGPPGRTPPVADEDAAFADDPGAPDPWVVGAGEFPPGLFGEDPGSGPPYAHVLRAVGYDDDGRPFYPPPGPEYTLTTGTDRVPAPTGAGQQED